MVGLSLALLLAAQRSDWNVLVVEAFAPPGDMEPGYRPSFDARSTALSDSSRDIFQQLGLWQQLSAHVADIAQVHVSDRGHIGSTRLSASEQGVASLGFVVENQWLGSVLLGAVQQQPRIDMAAPARLVALQAKRDSVSFVLDTGAEYQTSLLVVADGAQSETRDKLGIRAKTKDYGKSALIANVSLEKPHQNIAFERFTDQGPMALLPLTDLQGESRSALVWTMSPEQAEQLQQANEAVFLAELQQRFGYRLGKFQRVGERFCYPLKLIETTEQVRRNLVVIGNAAHSLHPVAGQGFNLSLRDAAMLADVLAGADMRQQPLGDLSVLEAYLQRQQKDQRQTTLLSDLLPTLFAFKTAPIALARNIGLLALDAVPPLRNQFARLGMGLDTRGSRLVSQSGREGDVRG
ncbi:MAG: 2-octaprenyl-6-methoxyphenyl hydroxylase [Pseudomonadales bacterium]|nr:2-octaprenyl-6-methoxyphenyl hydroxylase [Pseudomonadales bacterium]